MNNVLIIEDDKEICVMIKDHLEKYNYQVFFTLTGANAIERIKELSPDLIILDLMLPFISGDQKIFRRTCNCCFCKKFNIQQSRTATLGC